MVFRHRERNVGGRAILLTVGSTKLSPAEKGSARISEILAVELALVAKVESGFILVSERSIGGGDHFSDQTSGHDCESNQHCRYHGGERSTGDAIT